MSVKKKPKRAGDLDPTFGTEGTLTYVYTEGKIGGNTRLLSNDKILTAVALIGKVMLLQRLNNGEPDISFGDDGRKFVDVLPGANISTGLVLQSDGKALIFGSMGESFNEITYVMRALPDGNLDTTFGNAGRVFIDLPAGYDDVHALTVQPDGKILLAIRLNRSFNDYDEALVRLTATGRLDPTFNNSGIMFAGAVYFSKIIATPTDRLFMAGAKNNDLLFAQYLMNGTPDPDFGIDGFVTMSIRDSQYAEVTDLIRLNDGKFVAVGTARLKRGESPFVLRLQSDGDLDTSFNDGKPNFSSFKGYEVLHLAVAAQADDKVVVAGWSLGDANTSNFTLMRFLTNGEVDTGFGTQGGVMTDLGGLDAATAVSIQADGKIVVSGMVIASPKGSGGGIARYLA